jgi:beta-glucosidase
VDVTNESSIDGTEVVQVYVEDVIASVVVPNKSLRGFKKVVVPAGETRSVEVEVAVRELGLYDARMRYVVEPGEFRFLVSASSRDVRGTVGLEVVR